MGFDEEKQEFVSSDEDDHDADDAVQAKSFIDEIASQIEATRRKLMHRKTLLHAQAANFGMSATQQEILICRIMEVLDNRFTSQQNMTQFRNSIKLHLRNINSKIHVDGSEQIQFDDFPQTWNCVKKNLLQFEFPFRPLKMHACPKGHCVFVDELDQADCCPECRSLRTEAVPFMYMPISFTIQMLLASPAVSQLLWEGFDNVRNAVKTYSESGRQSNTLQEWLTSALFYEYYYPAHQDRIEKLWDKFPDIPLSDIMVLCFAHNFDGVQPYESSKVSLWPHLWTILTFPNEHMCKPSTVVMTSCGYWPSQAIWKLHVKELNYLWKGCKFYCAHKRRVVVVSSYLLWSVSDLPAFAKARCSAGHTAFHGACVCTVEGTRFEKKSRSTCYPSFGYPKPNYCSKEDFVAAADQSAKYSAGLHEAWAKSNYLKKNEPRHRTKDDHHPYKSSGVYDIPALLGLDQEWDPTRQFKPCFMHIIMNTVQDIYRMLDYESKNNAFTSEQQRLLEKSRNRLPSTWLEADLSMPRPYWALITGSQSSISEFQTWRFHKVIRQSLILC